MYPTTGTELSIIKTIFSAYPDFIWYLAFFRQLKCQKFKVLKFRFHDSMFRVM